MILLCPWLPDFPLNSCLFLSGSITRVKSRQSSITNDYVSMSTNMKIQIASTIPPLCIKIMRTLLWYRVCVSWALLLTIVVQCVCTLFSLPLSRIPLTYSFLPLSFPPSPPLSPLPPTRQERNTAARCAATPPHTPPSSLWVWLWWASWDFCLLQSMPSSWSMKRVSLLTSKSKITTLSGIKDYWSERGESRACISVDGKMV